VVKNIRIKLEYLLTKYLIFYTVLPVLT